MLLALQPLTVLKYDPIDGRLKTGVIAGSLMAIAATYVEHFGGWESNAAQLRDRDIESWDTNNKFRVLLHEENKAQREALRQKEFEVLKQL